MIAEIDEMNLVGNVNDDGGDREVRRGEMGISDKLTDHNSERDSDMFMNNRYFLEVLSRWKSPCPQAD